MIARYAAILASPLFVSAQGSSYGGSTSDADPTAAATGMTTGSQHILDMCDQVGHDRCDVRKAIGIAGDLINGVPVVDLPNLPSLCGCFDVLTRSAVTDIYAEASCRGEPPPPGPPPNNSSTPQIHGMATFPIDHLPADRGLFITDFANALADQVPGIDPAHVVVTDIQMGSLVVKYYIIVHQSSHINGVETALNHLVNHPHHLTINGIPAIDMAPPSYSPPPSCNPAAAMAFYHPDMDLLCHENRGALSFDDRHNCSSVCSSYDCCADDPDTPGCDQRPPQCDNPVVQSFGPAYEHCMTNHCPDIFGSNWWNASEDSGIFDNTNPDFYPYGLLMYINETIGFSGMECFCNNCMELGLDTGAHWSDEVCHAYYAIAPVVVENYTYSGPATIMPPMPNETAMAVADMHDFVSNSSIGSMAALGFGDYNATNQTFSSISHPGTEHGNYGPFVNISDTEWYHSQLNVSAPPQPVPQDYAQYFETGNTTAGNHSGARTGTGNSTGGR